MPEVEVPEGTTQADIDRALKALSKPKEDSIVFKQVESGTDGEIRVSYDTYKGRSFCAIRKYYTDKNSGELRPGKGVTFSYEDIEEIQEGLTLMQEYLGEHLEV